MSDFLNHLKDRSFGMLGFDRGSSPFAYIDYDSEVVVFPLWNLSGQLRGYQTYRWKASKVRDSDNPTLQRYFTRLPKGDQEVYGLQLLPENYLGPLFLVEGIWEVIYGCAFGIPCIATLGSDPKYLRGFINTLPNKVYALVQPDKAGKKLAKYGKNGAIFLDGDLDDCLRDSGWFGVPDELSSDKIWGRDGSKENCT